MATARWYSSTTQTQIGTSPYDKCIISSGLVWKIYKWDILGRFVVWIPCDAAQCRGMWQMQMATNSWYTTTSWYTQTQIGTSHNDNDNDNDKCPIPSELVSKTHKCDVGVQQAHSQCPPTGF